LYSSLNIIRVVKSRKTGWTKHAQHIGKMRNLYKNSVAKSERNALFEIHRRRRK